MAEMFSRPCPCGYFKSAGRKCTCTPQAIRQYIAKISGPLLDRIDPHIGVNPVKMDNPDRAESSGRVRERVMAARAFQNDRSKCCNALLNTAMVREFCLLGKTGQEVLSQAMVQYKLSARSYERILKVSRTIADLAGARKISLEHLSEAIAYRQLDKDYLSR